MQEVTLLGQGGYGCVYRPSIECDGELGSVQYVSKIQTKSNTVERELEHSRKLREQLKDTYMFLIAAIEDSCQLTPQNEKSVAFEAIMQSCEPLQKSRQKHHSSTRRPFDESIVVTRMRYLGKRDILVYLYDAVRHRPGCTDDVIMRRIAKKLWSAFHQLLVALEKFREIQFVHFDIKDANIMMDVNTHGPMLIDMGLSFFMEEARTESKVVFYTAHYYPYWPIESFLCNHIVHNLPPDETARKQPIPRPELAKVIHTYRTSMEETMRSHGTQRCRLLTRENFDLWENRWMEALTPFTSWEQLFQKLTEVDVMQTWDMFALAMAMLNTMGTLFVGDNNNNKLTLEQSETLKELEECCLRCVMEDGDNADEGPLRRKYWKRGELKQNPFL